MVRKAKKAGIKVNFKGVEAGAKALPDGTYTVTVEEVEQFESEGGNDCLKWKLKVSEGKNKGRVIFDNTSLQPQALFRLRGLLESLGHEVEDSEVTLDLSEFIGKSMVVEVANETYQGKKNPKVVTYGSAEDAEDSDDDSDDSDDDSADEEETEVDADDDDDEDEKPAAKKKAPAKKTAAKKKKAAVEEDEDDDDSDDSDDSDDDDDDSDDSDDDSDDSDDDEEPSIKVKDKVKFVDDKGKVQKGKVVKIVKDNALIDVSGKEWKVPVDELTVI